MADSPIYLKTKSEGRLQEKLASLEALLSPCRLCPRRCGVDRAKGQAGFCSAPYGLFISAAFSHYGEEAPLVGTGGSGTIFLSHCNIKCVFCQNHEISIRGEGVASSPDLLAAMMLNLQRRGCHNINLVTPTHYVPHLVRALDIAIDRGLTLPLVYNCGGYESIEVLKCLEGVVDIYMPDIKFLDPGLSARFCNAPDYPEIVTKAVEEMHRQLGDLRLDHAGIARRGVLVRHLVMPRMVENTKAVLRFIGDRISRDAFVNIMAQYHPCHEASRYEELSRKITNEEYREALGYARSIGLKRAGGH